MIKCEGACKSHNGKVKEILVCGLTLDYGIPISFNYCDEAIEEDRKNGFTVVIKEEFEDWCEEVAKMALNKGVSDLLPKNIEDLIYEFSDGFSAYEIIMIIKDWKKRIMLEVQNFLKQYDNIEQGLSELESIYKIRSKTVDNLICLNYTQFEAPKDKEIVKECRGLILDKNTLEVVAYPFRRFFNIQEEAADSINFENKENLVLWSKSDGSLLNIFVYDDELNFSTRGCPFAEGNINNNPDKTFNDLANEAVEINDYHVSKLWEYAEKYTLVCELIGPENRVVTPYEKTELRLLGARDKNLCELGLAMLVQISQDTRIPLPKIYEFNSKEDLLYMAENLPQMEEGYVLVDYGQQTNGSYHRVKIKNPAWIAIHNLIGNNFSEKRALELVLNGECGEFISYYPEYEDLIKKMQKFVNEFDNQLENDYNNIKHLSDNRKEFALKAVKTKISGYLFAKLDGKVNSAKEYIKNMNLDKLMEIYDGN